jgi:hypothetical protein
MWGGKDMTGTTTLSAHNLHLASRDGGAFMRVAAPLVS